MKKTALALALFGFFAALAQNENCPSLKLKTGTKLIYKTETAPAATYAFTGDYIKSSEKDKKKTRDKFYKDNPWTFDVQTNEIKIVPNNNGTVEIISSVTRNSTANVTSDFAAFCKNDTLVNRPGFTTYKDGNLTSTSTYYNVTPNAKNDGHTGFTMIFEKATPNNLEVGQKLLDQQVMFMFTTTGEQNIKFPKQEEVSREITSYGNYNRYGRWEETYSITTSKFETTMIDVIIETAITSEVWTKNRMVKEKKDVTVSGQTYTAYLISEETWTGGFGYEVKTDNPFINKKNAKFADKMAKKSAEAMREMAGANEDGYIVTYTEYWYIPGIGAYNMTSYNQYHEKIGYLELVEIQ
jgi:hypothetical protein